MNNSQAVFKMLGGSHSYGLNTPSSDVDNRGVFLNTELRYVLGLDKHEHQQYTDAGADDKFKEFRHFLQLLRESNTEALEMLFAKNYELCSPLFALVRKERFRLLNSKRLFAALSGYMQGELKRANGVLAGKLGKRRDAILDHGFSEKNFAQLIRLGHAGCVFFAKGYFPVNVREENPTLADRLVLLKTQPRLFQVEQLNEEAKALDLSLKLAYETRTRDFVFDSDFANELVLKAYFPLLRESYERLLP